MFQNITENQEENEQTYKKRIDVRNLFKINDIILYAVAFMISMVGFDETLAPFGLAIFAATCSNRTPVGVLYLIVLIRNSNRFWN